MLHRGKSRVDRRRVFYIPGYDPYPPRRYRELYRAESAKQAGISDYRIEMKPLRGETGWMVRSDMEGGRTVSRVEVLVWHDLVQSSMSGGIWATYLALIRTVWIYLSTGAFRRLSWLAKGPVIAALYPIVMLLGQFLLALLGAGVVASLAGFVTLRASELAMGLAGRAPIGWVAAIVSAAVFWGVFLPVFVAAMRWFKSKDDKTFAYYLMQDYAYTASERGAYPAEIEARLHEFRHRIEAALRDPDVDEVLVVGHSSGAQLAVSVVADIVRLNRVPERGAVLSLLTLGQVIPMVSFLPKARRLRGDLRLLSMAETITWLDVSAPGDGCSFALSDPVAVTGVAPAKGQQWPLIISAAFSKTLAPETLKAMRWRFFRLHFQYLCAFDRPGDYDYFRITAGPQTLAQRFRGRRPSASRIDVPASRFTSTMHSVVR
ncbi:hypothetical protein GQ651_07380 [Alphaproteobacteria bacterium GH1-50]|uniref:Alpha/beta hydrolase family protein n=1 Tax=Kangsaoukella pontilimi TaxID=2691042 RepID=A0A7C9IFL9_9RHOB|nr:hypothetical protein [Kangsaoukella pontilimi]MXQ07664.1 hypothetical protein [Kangsaoukella pontilimi]